MNNITENLKRKQNIIFQIHVDYKKILLYNYFKTYGEVKMRIRNYDKKDISEIAELFYNTVHSINKRDYTDEEVNAWADGNLDIEKWDKDLSNNYSIIAEEDGKIVGFGDIAVIDEQTGYLSKLFVHKDYQSIGIASAICDRLENAKDFKQVRVHASITAKPFFLKRGYNVIKKNLVERHGIILTNFLMEKAL